MTSFDERTVRLENIPAWYDADKVKADFHRRLISVPYSVKIFRAQPGASRTWGVVTFYASNEARWFVERIAKVPDMLVWFNTKECAVVQVDVFLTERPRAEGVGRWVSGARGELALWVVKGGRVRGPVRRTQRATRVDPRGTARPRARNASAWTDAPPTTAHA